MLWRWLRRVVWVALVLVILIGVERLYFGSIWIGPRPREKELAAAIAETDALILVAWRKSRRTCRPSQDVENSMRVIRQLVVCWRAEVPGIPDEGQESLRIGPAIGS